MLCINEYPATKKKIQNGVATEFAEMINKLKPIIKFCNLSFFPLVYILM